MKHVSEYRDAALVRGIASAVARIPRSGTLRFMEVCGGHTAAIYRFGLPSLLPPNIQFLHGPGCPVCVTANDFVDRAVALAKIPGITIATFGDLVRVPGSTRSLADVRADGGDVRIFYSAADALDLARTHPNRIVVFLGIGFETTACTIAATMSEAVRDSVRNFRLLCSLKTMPQALRVLLSSPGSRIDGMILPGHVTTVTGTGIYHFITEEFDIPCVVSGFEPLDLVESVRQLCRQCFEDDPRIENPYRRVANETGNRHAQAAIARMFEPCDITWRGFGTIPQSGLRLRPEFSEWDALSISADVEPLREHGGCRCGDVLRGILRPTDCELFGATCTPENPRGACMVSSEGACSAFYHYAQVDV